MWRVKRRCEHVKLQLEPPTSGGRRQEERHTHTLLFFCVCGQNKLTSSLVMFSTRPIATERGCCCLRCCVLHAGCNTERTTRGEKKKKCFDLQVLLSAPASQLHSHPGTFISSSRLKTVSAPPVRPAASHRLLFYVSKYSRVATFGVKWERRQAGAQSNERQTAAPQPNITLLAKTNTCSHTHTPVLPPAAITNTLS